MIPFFERFHRPKAPIILQQSETECGIAALAMLFAYYQVHVSMDVLREKCGVTRDGCKAETLINVAKAYGFEAGAYKIEIDELKLAKDPVIAFWNFSHYIVVNGFKRQRFSINDPAHGALPVSLDEFDKAYTGIVIAIYPTENTRLIKKNVSIKPLMLQWLAEYKLPLLFLALCTLLLVTGPLLTSGLTKIFIDQVVIGQHIDWIPWIALIAIFFTLINITAIFNQKWYQFKLITTASLEKSSAIIKQVLWLPLLYFSLRQKGELTATLTRTELIISTLSKSAVTSSVAIITILFCFIWMLKLNVLLSITSFISIFLITTIHYYFTQLNLINEKSNLHVMGKIYSHTLSSIRNIETIKSCGLEDHIINKWYGLFCDKLRIRDKLNTLMAFNNTSNRLISSTTLFAFIIVGAIITHAGIISIGNLLGIYSLHLFISNATTTLIATLQNNQQAYITHHRINDMTHAETDSRFQSKTTANPIDNTPIIQCQDISFYYNPSSAPTLQNISLDIWPGQHIALIGPTGSGKSTLAKLLAGLYQAHHGRIAIFGNNITELNTDYLARTFSYVSQDTTLFSGTLYDNLTLWNNHIDINLINQAIHDTCLTELLSARTLTGIVEENGQNFSGGERQRIDIARALIQNTSVLVLDEATSALDVDTESKIINHLRNRNTTIIFVAHRLSTIQHCDQIILMKQGQIIEQGTHDQLLTHQGHYHELHQLEHRSLQLQYA
jgi:ABC-type bacteriocin/lantibiotic exporter with double-glycine peptidase domain